MSDTPRRRRRPAAPLATALALALLPGALLVAPARELAAQPAAAQGTGRVAGTVLGEGGRPVSGAQVIVVGTRVGAVTDDNGRYNIGGVPAGAQTIRVQRIGFTPRTQPVTVATGQVATLDFQLTVAPTTLSAVQVVGYTNEARRDVSGAVTTVSGNDIRDQKVATVEQALRGRVPGVQIQSTGQPGRPADIIVRGQTSLRGSSPLYVVDGMYLGNQNPNLNPDDIASINILKDASAAAQYGSQASNGVVVITTRRGQAGQNQFTVSAYYGTQSIPKTIPVAGTAEWQRVYQTAYKAAGLTPPAGVTAPATVSTDWQNALFKTGGIQNYNLQASGGTPTASYLISGGVLDQQGTVINTNFRRYSVRVNSQATRGRFTIGENLAASQGNQRGFGQGIFGGSALPLIDVVTLPPAIPIYDPNNPGGYGYGSTAIPNYGVNPVGAQTAGYNKFRSNAVIGSGFATVNLLPGLNYRLNLGVNYNDSTASQFNSSTQLRYLTVPNNPANSLILSRPNFLGLLYENLLTYDGSFGGGQHRLTAVAGQTSQRNSYDQLQASRGNLSSEQLQQINAGSTLFQGTVGYAVPFRTNSLLSRATYAFRDRYLATASVRRDCSSRFSPASKCGVFGAGSLGWVVSEEGFFKNLPGSGSIDQLKLRASTGVLGDQNIGDFAYQSVATQNINYIFGSGIVSGTVPTAVSNPNLKWQRNRSTDVGLDLGLFQGALSITADYYSNIADQFLVNLPVPLSLGSTGGNNGFLGGVAYPAFNAGKLKNAGFELGITHHMGQGTAAGGTADGFRMNTTFTLTTLANKVLSLGNGGQPVFNGAGPQVERTAVGSPIGEFYVRKTCGLFQNAAQIQAHTTTVNGKAVALQSGAQPGDVCYQDLNGDGQITDADRYNAGTPTPKLTTGLFLEPRYRAFDFGLNLRGSFGNKIYNQVKRATQNTQDLHNIRSGLTFWSPSTPNTSVPRAVFGDAAAQNFLAQSDYWLESGNFVRLQNIVVGYTLPAGAVRQLRLNTATSPRIYVNAQNVYTFTRYSGFDPEIQGFGDPLGRGIDDGFIYPNPRTITFGFDLRF